LKTIGQLKDKIKKFTCTEEESFISDAELNCFIDMAQKKAATKIACLNKEYFTSMVEVPVTKMQESVDLPEDIRATKVKSVFWQSEGSKCCTRIQRADYSCIGKDCPSTPCEYVFLNKKDEGSKLYLNPISNKAGTLTIIYERVPCDIADDASDDTTLEFEEMCDYIFQYVKLRVYEKEKNPLASLTVGELNEAEQDMLDCLCPQFGDDCEVKPDAQWRCYVDEGYGYGSGW
jgi:hypothetical protein